jgi:hypothetical protein
MPQRREASTSTSACAASDSFLGNFPSVNGRNISSLEPEPEPEVVHHLGDKDESVDGIDVQLHRHHQKIPTTSLLPGTGTRNGDCHDERANSITAVQ